ncbi:DUF669 domain-containing protein [Acetobacterium wieringae]|uniref:DUF669 domain-containing protein n=1 Tax=Acetobacterium wieringae TaxID=52694 RepID=UPI002033A920|nr:DUF669 domain-containing protein [Acetobacterium wieringae]URN85172.1 DUF669 domain-containing protein [Acetobacterium wieringae]
MSEFVEERELGWDDQIENDGPDFTLLPAGDYDFVVTEFERQRHNGSEKLPPCNKAVVSLKFETPEGTTTVKHNLFLHTKTEGMLCAFFTAIGQRKKGEKLTMNWNSVVGSTGRAKLKVREWTNEKGELKQFNEVQKFYEPDESKPATVDYTPGSF